MAKEYIERETAVQSVCNGCNIMFDDELCEPSDCYIRGKLIAIPPSDVAPVRHGRWIDLREDDMDYEWKCSSCGETFGMAHEDVSPYDVGLNYCPNCGAKMDLEG